MALLVSTSKTTHNIALGLICIERNRMRIFFFDPCHCLMWTLNWNEYKRTLNMIGLKHCRDHYASLLTFEKPLTKPLFWNSRVNRIFMPFKQQKFAWSHGFYWAGLFPDSLHEIQVQIFTCTKRILFQESCYSLWIGCHSLRLSVKPKLCTHSLLPNLIENNFFSNFCLKVDEIRRTHWL